MKKLMLFALYILCACNSLQANEPKNSNQSAAIALETTESVKNKLILAIANGDLNAVQECLKKTRLSKIDKNELISFIDTYAKIPQETATFDEKIKAFFGNRFVISLLQMGIGAVLVHKARTIKQKHNRDSKYLGWGKTLIGSGLCSITYFSWVDQSKKNPSKHELATIKAMISCS